MKDKQPVDMKTPEDEDDNEEDVEDSVGGFVENLEKVNKSNVNKIVFIFICFIVIAGGEVRQVLSCQMQKQLRDNMYLKHVVGVLLIFAFIMLEGGWSFDKELQDKKPVSWENGDSVSSLIYGVILYFIFLVTSKMNYNINILFYLLFFILYLINSERSFLFERSVITKSTNGNIELIELILLILALCVGLYGIVEYYLAKVKEYKNNFSNFNFLFGIKECKGLKKKIVKS